MRHAGVAKDPIKCRLPGSSFQPPADDRLNWRLPSPVGQERSQTAGRSEAMKKLERHGRTGGQPNKTGGQLILPPLDLLMKDLKGRSRVRKEYR